MASHKLLLSLLLCFLALPAGAKTYCCSDEHGRRICGDILPEQCQSRAYSEFNSQGVLSRQYPGPLTPEQRARLKAEKEQKEMAEHKAAEQARRDHALLASYSSVADIDDKRNRTMVHEQANLRNAEERLGNAEARRQRLQKSAERYADKPMPEVLQTNLRISQTELTAARAAVEEAKRNLADADKRFTEDRKRFIELTAKHPAGDAVAPPASGTTPR